MGLAPKLEILDFRPDFAQDFREINEEWIQDMFALEEKDRKVLGNPQEIIIDPGGHILFVRHPELGIVGTGALLKTGPNEFELTKMGVLKSARGLKAGELLLQAVIDRAREIDCENLYLLTNSKCEAAIHLYLKNGFRHDVDIRKRFGSQYQRCDVAMRWFAAKI